MITHESWLKSPKEEPESRQFLSTETFNKIKEKIATVKGKLTQTRQMFSKWGDNNNEQRDGLVKEVVEALKKVDSEVTTVDLEVLALEVSI